MGIPDSLNMSHDKAELESGQSVENSTLEAVYIDHAAEKKLVRKLDWYIIPTVMTTYLLCFLDRVNIGNARLYNLEADLGLTGSQYQTAVSVLFITYVLIEVPSNLLLKRFTPSRWIAIIMVVWGIISTLTGIVQNFAGLVVCRLLLGLVEGGLFPGLTVYLTLFYTKKEIALRIGYLFVSSALAGACGGLLAYGIGFMSGIAGMSGWRWIFIVEGNLSFRSCRFTVTDTTISQAFQLCSSALLSGFFWRMIPVQHGI